MLHYLLTSVTRGCLLFLTEQMIPARRATVLGRSHGVRAMSITLYNSKSRAKEAFVPIDPQNVRMYVCGPTVYDRAHLGNARPAIVFDVLYRLLRHTYGANHVTYVRNFTDVDDKINAKAAATGRSIGDICDETIGWYLDDMDAVGVARPTHMPRATEYIGQMVAMIAGLIASGHAYAAQGHVMFRVRSYKNYGALSGRSVDDMIAGARVEISPFKEDPMDFVLWKPSDSGVPGWDSPWGYGRPGWHIECSAMAQELLGESFDIHGGGLDLQFPHHENELAQSTCAHPQGEFARVWMHNEMLQVEGKKMSKSLGNFFTVRDLLDKGVAGEVIRFVMLSTHYRSPMDWTVEKAVGAELKLFGIVQLIAQYGDLHKAGKMSPIPEIVDALSDDLNTHEALRLLCKLNHAGVASELAQNAVFLGLYSWNSLAQKVDEYRKTTEALPRIALKLQQMRLDAKTSKDFSPVDKLKQRLSDANFSVMMERDNVSIRPEMGFDPAKLEGLI